MTEEEGVLEAGTVKQQANPLCETIVHITKKRTDGRRSMIFLYWLAYAGLTLGLSRQTLIHYMIKITYY